MLETRHHQMVHPDIWIPISRQTELKSKNKKRIRKEYLEKSDIRTREENPRVQTNDHGLVFNQVNLI